MNGPTDDLKALFAEADARLDPTDFTARVLQDVRRDRLQRRMILIAAAAIGGAFAAAQLPALLSVIPDTSGVSAAIGAASLDADASVMAWLRNPPLLALALAAALAASLAALTPTEAL